MFWDLPTDQKCEWLNLQKFVECYNQINSSDYWRVRCLDIDDRTNSQPELLLENSEQTQVVIERKTVIWPPPVAKLWRIQHDFANRVSSKLGDYFHDDVYVLNINNRDLRVKKQVLDSRIESIVQMILDRQDQIHSTGGIGNKSPVSWSFYRVPKYERTDDMPTSGIIVEINYPFEFFDDDELKTTLKSRSDALIGIQNIFTRQLQDTTKKFFAYPNAQRVMVVQFHTDESVLVTDEDVIKMIQETQIPPTIDEIWIANPEWISQEEFEIAYSRLYLASQNGSR